MTELYVSVKNDNYVVKFAVQKRIDRNVTCKDVICYGVYESAENGGGGPKQLMGVAGYTRVLIPTIAYQSIKDSYDKKAGQKLALERFLKRNSVPDFSRELIWKAFLLAFEPNQVEKKTPVAAGESVNSGGGISMY